jgi:parallel beta-helix repeat protein
MYLLGRHTRTRPSRRPRLEVEAVEGRSLLSTLFVSTTGSFNGHPAFTSIQTAVNAAKPGDTIDVAAGTYHENVSIGKSLALRGAQAGVNPITGLRTKPANESTVDGGITITSNASVGVDGFSLNDPGGVPLDDQSGVADLLTNNIILPGARVAGIEVFDAPLTTVSDNEVEGTRLFGISVDGITVVGSPPRHLDDAVRANEVLNSSLEGINVSNAVGVEVDGNDVSGSAGFGLNVQQSSVVRATNNLLVTNAGGAVFFNSSGNFIQGNTVEFNRIDGLDDEGDHGDIIQANSLVGNATSGVGNALFLSNASSGETVENNSVLQNHSNAIEVFGTSTGVTISGNTVENNGGDGIGLNGTTHSIVTGNTVKSNAVGIHFAGASFNHVIGNVVDNNRIVGIRLDHLSFFNTVSKNTALNNGIFDAEDDSIGTGTAGTENNWTGNTEKKDNHGGGLGH